MNALRTAATVAILASCSTRSEPSDSGPDAANTCVIQCEACALSYCAGQCSSVNGECIMNADGDCDAIRRCIMGPITQ
jgi:hypothetical protein